MRRAEEPASLRVLNEELLPALGRAVSEKGDYYDMLVAFLERTAEELAIDPFAVVTDAALLEEVKARRRILAPNKPGRLLRSLPMAED